ncbi:MAG: hypothetical protein RR318_07835, partial [Alistipes sp.]
YLQQHRSPALRQLRHRLPALRQARFRSNCVVTEQHLDTSSRVILITGRLLLNVLAVRQEKIVARWKM